jgi:hypothetical protein
MTKYLLGAATAFALLSAPALACDSCNKKDTTAQADKKDDNGCHCTKDGGTCKCGEKCTCDHCKAKGSEKKPEPKKA